MSGKLRNLIEHFADGGDMEVVRLLFDRGIEMHEQVQRTTLQNATYRSKLEILVYNAAYRGEVEAPSG